MLKIDHVVADTDQTAHFAATKLQNMVDEVLRSLPYEPRWSEMCGYVVRTDNSSKWACFGRFWCHLRQFWCHFRKCFTTGNLCYLRNLYPLIRTTGETMC